MQTDPIGYADGMNMYAYVGSDPVNGVDYSGMVWACTHVEGIGGGCVWRDEVDFDQWKSICSFLGMGSTCSPFPDPGLAPPGTAPGDTAPAGEDKQGREECPPSARGQGQPGIPRGAGAINFSDAEIIARRFASQELARTQKITDNYRLVGHNDIYDAERHARWVYRMAMAIGSGWAGVFATGHEGEGLLGVT